MLIPLDEQQISKINNSQLQQYARIYTHVQSNFQETIGQFGLMQAKEVWQLSEEELKQLLQQQVISRNNHHSYVYGSLSKACEACQKGVGSITIFISLQCSRDCFFCFNPNQENYHYFLHHKRDVVQELKDHWDKGEQFTQIALSGGEPLLFKDETEQFFVVAKQLYPSAYTRLYTSGDFLDEAFLVRLQQAKLDEIRFSIKTDDDPGKQEQVLALIKLAKRYLPRVMVEMPVLPDELEIMKVLLKKLDQAGADGINLLELCFPMHNAQAFKQKGYEIKANPYEVLYDYWYAGGLPIQGSEAVCFALLDFASKEKLRLGVHYCSLENKHTGQIYQQNYDKLLSPMDTFSVKDYFIKTAKVFGEDAEKLLHFFEKTAMKDYYYDENYQMLVFSVKQIRHLKKQFAQMPILIGYHVLENREDGLYNRELQVMLTTPEIFNFKQDI